MSYKILSMSDSLLISTGYATQARNIMQRLAKLDDFEIIHFGWQFIGNPLYYYPDSQTLSENRKKEGIYLLPNNGKNPFGADVLQPYIKRFRPDLTWVLCDTFMLFDWVLNVDFAPSKFLMYFPSDGTPMPMHCETILKKANYPVSMSKFAQKQVKDFYNIDVDYIPHGIDTNFYHPIDENKKNELRMKWSPRLNIDLIDKFVVCAVGRFQGRKAHPELLKAWQQFSKDKRDVVLLLHCDPEDPAGLSPFPVIFDLIRKYKIEPTVRFTGTKVWYQFSFEDYREVYQISDVHALTTTGEGFGIPTIEASSCGLPNVITDYTTTHELITEDKTGISVPIKNTITGTWGVERAFVDIDKFVESLNALYYDRKMGKTMGMRGRESVIRKYDWDKVVFPQWEKYIRKCLE